MAFAVAIACASICSAQEARVVKALPNDQFIVEIAGKEYRAINGDKAVELAKQKVELQGCKENETRYAQLNDIAKRDVTIAQQQRDIEHANFVHAMSLYEKERELRTQAMQFIPHGNVKGFGGWLLKAIDSPYGQAAFKLVMPTAQFVKVMKQ